MSDYSFSFSGSDCHTFVSFMSPSLYGENSIATKVKLDCINTISISVHEQRTPVRRLGHSGVVGFAGSVRTVAGSIIMTIVKDNPFDELITKSDIRKQWGARITSNDSGSEIYKDIKHPYNYKGYSNSYEYLRTNNSPQANFKIQNLTTLPAMKFRMEFVSEYYRAKKQPYSSSINKSEERPLLRVMELHNVFIISENVVTSVNNMVTELVLQYVASDYVEFTEELTPQQVAQAKKEQVAPSATAKEIKKEQPVIEQSKAIRPIVPAAPAVQNVSIVQDQNDEPTIASSQVLDDILNNIKSLTSPPKANNSNATSQTIQSITPESKTIPSTTPETLPAVSKLNTPATIKTGGTTVTAKAVNPSINNKVAIFDKDIIEKIKINKYNADEEIAKNLKDKDLKLPISELFQAESVFDYNSFKSNNFQNKLASNNPDPNNQPDLTKENPLFAIAALSEDPTSKIKEYGYRKYTNEDKYTPLTRGNSFSRSSSNKKNSPYPSEQQETIFFEKFNEKIKGKPIDYDDYDDLFNEVKKELNEGDTQLWNEQKSNHKYSSIENFKMNYNSRVLFDDAPMVNDKKLFFEKVESNNLIPSSLKDVYKENFKALLYEDLNLIFNYSGNVNQKKDSAQVRLEDKKEVLFNYLLKTNQITESEKREFQIFFNLEITRIKNELFKE